MLKVSIITPSYNSEDFISDTIRSIQNQTYKNWELLITDDFSSDSTIKIIQALQTKDDRIKLFQLNNNQGAAVARNNSIEKASGRYIAFCDSDDLWLPNKLFTQVNFLLDYNLSFTFSGYKICNEYGEIIAEKSAIEELTYNEILENNYIGCLTAIYDTDKLNKIYMPLLRNRQDWGLWIKIMKKVGSTKAIGHPLAIYRYRRNSISSNKIKMIKYTWLIYFKVVRFNFLKSVYFTLAYVIKKVFKVT
jgi:glycosyltransferase involved in cell wall biosynthesis